MTAQPLLPAALAASFLLASSNDVSSPAAERYWPQWRGPQATGVAPYARPPLEWSETKNIRWKKPIPGRGAGTPVVWGDRIFVLTAVPATVEVATPDDTAPCAEGSAHKCSGRGVVHRYTVLALDRKDGHVVWERVGREEAPHERTHHEHGTFSSPSAVTDGDVVIASFESRGIYAYDMKGTLLWEKDFGDKRMRSEFGEGSSPALHGDTVVILWDHQGESFIVALDKRTGKERWRVAREEIDSWATPLIVDHEGRMQVITAGMNRIRSYDLETGDVVWHGEGLTMYPIPSPVFGNGLVFLTSGYRGYDLQAIRLADAKGDITGSRALVWSYDRDTPYVPSPLLYDGVLYILKTNSGILLAFDAATGKKLFGPVRIEAVPNILSSPVGAAGRVYFAGLEGTTVVLKQGSTFEVLAQNKLDDSFTASPALVEGELYLRGRKYLYSIAEN